MLRALLIQFIRFYKYFSVIFIGCVSLTCVSIAVQWNIEGEHTHTHWLAEAVSIRMLSIQQHMSTTMKIGKNNGKFTVYCWFAFFFVFFASFCASSIFLELEKKLQVAVLFFIGFAFYEKEKKQWLNSWLWSILRLHDFTYAKRGVIFCGIIVLASRDWK